jgi:hypothetical protein
MGSDKNDLSDPTDIAIDKPKSARPEQVGSVGSDDPTSFLGNKKINRGRKKKKFRKLSNPTNPKVEKRPNPA